MIHIKKSDKRKERKKKNYIIPIQKRQQLPLINITNNNNIIKNNNYMYHNNSISKNNNNIIMTNNNRKKINSNNNKNNLEKIKNIMKYTYEETNKLSYNFALIKDKRTYCQYYISLLKTKHNLIFSFCNNNDYDSKIIKMDLFLIGFTIDYIVNALFFNDDTMHNIYENKGVYDLEDQISIVAYSSLISMVLNKLLKFLSLSNGGILSFKVNI